MLKIILTFIIIPFITSHLALAGDVPVVPPIAPGPAIPPQPPIPVVPPKIPIPPILPIPTRPLCFNLLCNYNRIDPVVGFQHCQAASVFEKLVGLTGFEIPDYSAFPFNPQFEVECDQKIIYNSSAHRFTDIFGTRIQAESGPFPAILLPIGSLREEHRYILSSLELGSQQMPGFCYIYNGAP